MMKKTQIVLKFIWGLAIYCDGCGAWLKRYGKRVDPQYFQVDPEAPAFCTTCERKQIAEDNAKLRAERKAKKEAEARAEHSKLMRKERNRRYYEKKKK
jgi:dsRNA-specific ribonuclease